MLHRRNKIEMLLLLVLCAVLFCAADTVEAVPGLHGTAAADVASAPRMHIGVVSIPLYGHFMPLKAAGEALLARGHTVSLFVENSAWCVTALEQKFTCVVIPASGRFTADFFVNMSAHPRVGDSFAQIFNEMFLHHTQQLGPMVRLVTQIHQKTPFSLFLVDLSTFVGYGVADKLNVPYVSMFPLTMHMAVGPTTYLPAIGTGFPSNGRMSTGQRLLNYLLKIAIAIKSGDLLGEVNAPRLAEGIAPMKHVMQLAGLEGLIFSPTIWGYDIPQPLCPNIFGVGILSPTHDHTPMERELEAFLAQCASEMRSAVYVNFGTLAVLHDQTFAALLDGLVQTSYCIVWKITNAQRLAAVKERLVATGDIRRFFLSSRFSNPVAIMKHPATGAFVSHCGDTSVLEAIEANLPIVGIPIFADQADVCLRVDESRIGIYVGHKLEFTAQRLADSLNTVTANRGTEFRRNLRRMKDVSDFLGGSAKVADVIETRFYNRLIHGAELLERCHFLGEALVALEGGQWRLTQSDVTLLWVAVAVFWVLMMRVIFSWCWKARSPKNTSVEKGQKKK